MTSASPVSIRKPGRRRRAVGLGLACLAILSAAGWLTLPYAVGWYYWRAAQQAFDQRDFATARAHLAPCLRAWPNSAGVQLAASRAARQTGFLDEADEHLRACQRVERDVSPETTLEVTLLQIKRGPMTQAQEKYLHDHLQQGSTDVLGVLEALTDQYMRRSRYVEAARLLDTWLERRPEDVEALVRHGWVSDHLFDVDATCRYYEKALALDPARDTVRLRLAELLLLNNRAAEARPQLETLRQKSHATGVAVAYARCLDQLGQIKEAGQLLDQVLHEHPEDAQALSERGKVALDEQKSDEAEDYLTRALKHSPRDRQILYYMTQCMERQKKKDAAAKYSRLLKEIDDDIKAVGQLVQAVMSSPRDADLRYRIGVIFLKNGQEDEAMHWFATALEENPVHRDTHQTLADYFARSGNAERAAKHRHIVESLAPHP